MTPTEIADMLVAIISETPATQELYPLLCALAKVADKLKESDVL